MRNNYTCHKYDPKLSYTWLTQNNAKPVNTQMLSIGEEG